MLRTRSIVFAIVLGSWCGIASAFVTGGQLVEICGVTPSKATSLNACISYIRGAAERADWELLVRNYKMAEPEPGDTPAMQEYKRNLVNVYCPPGNGESAAQGIAVVQKYLRDNPARWDSPAVILVVDALQDAFPCK